MAEPPDIENELIRSRPRPSREFKSELGTHLKSVAAAGAPAKEVGDSSPFFAFFSPKVAIGTYSFAGVFLLGIAVVGLVGSGPFAA